MNETEKRLSEQMMVLRCQAGDDNAFGELFEAYHERLRYYVARLQGRPRDTDDVLQQVWIDVYRKLPTLRSPKAFRVWVYRIARDKVYAGFRKQIHLPLEERNQDIPEEPHQEPTFSLEEVEQVHACLEKLSTEHRDILMLRFLEDMTYEEIAATLCCQLGTVRSRIYYAKRVLRRKMEELYHDNR